MYDNRPTAATKTVKRNIEVIEQRRRRAARKNRIVWIVTKALLAATFAIAIIKSII